MSDYKQEWRDRKGLLKFGYDGTSEGLRSDQILEIFSSRADGSSGGLDVQLGW
jgi:hypothetical protein